jgi:hypothetical protein
MMARSSWITSDVTFAPWPEHVRMSDRKYDRHVVDKKVISWSTINLYNL